MEYNSGKLCVVCDKEGAFTAHTTTKTPHRMKLRVTKGDSTATYDIDHDGNSETFPLQFGDGRYEISLCENTSGKDYMKCGTVRLDIKMENENAPFLQPNQYVNYSPDSAVVATAEELCEGQNEETEYKTICDYVESSYLYDFIKAATIGKGILPYINTTAKKHMGICQDLAALTVAMLRSRGIPSKLVIGNADQQYHAWVETLINGTWKRYDPTKEIGAISHVKHYEPERFY